MAEQRRREHGEDMMDTVVEKTPEQLAAVTARGDRAALVRVLDDLPPSEAARLISRMEVEQQT
jgi:hypothetical protein